MKCGWTLSTYLKVGKSLKGNRFKFRLFFFFDHLRSFAVNLIIFLAFLLLNTNLNWSFEFVFLSGKQMFSYYKKIGKRLLRILTVYLSMFRQVIFHFARHSILTSIVQKINRWWGEYKRSNRVIYYGVLTSIPIKEEEFQFIYRTHLYIFYPNFH